MPLFIRYALCIDDMARIIETCVPPVSGRVGIGIHCVQFITIRQQVDGCNCGMKTLSRLKWQLERVRQVEIHTDTFRISDR